MGKVGTGTEDLMKSLGELETAAEQLDLATGTDVQKSQQDTDLNKSDKGDDKDDKGAKEKVKADEVAEGGEEGTGAAEGDGNDEGEDTEKSVKAMLEAQEDVQKALEVSDFLLALTEANSDAIEGIRKSVKDSMSAQSEVSGMLVKSISAIAKAQTSIIKSINSINENVTALVDRIDGIERTPTVRKSVGAAGVKVVERPLAKSVGAGVDNDAGSTALNKSQIASQLSDLLMKGEPGITTMDILSFESGSELRPEIKAKLGIQ